MDAKPEGEMNGRGRSGASRCEAEMNDRSRHRTGLEAQVEAEVEPEEDAKVGAIVVAERNVGVEAESRRSKGRVLSSRPTSRRKTTDDSKRWMSPRRTRSPRPR